MVLLPICKLFFVEVSIYLKYQISLDKNKAIKNLRLLATFLMFVCYMIKKRIIFIIFSQYHAIKICKIATAHKMLENKYNGRNIFMHMMYTSFL